MSKINITAITHHYDVGLKADVYGARTVPEGHETALVERYREAVKIMLSVLHPGADITIKAGQPGTGARTEAFVGDDKVDAVDLQDKIHSFYSNNFPGRGAVTCLLSDDQGLCVYKDFDLLGLAPVDGGPWIPATGRVEPMGWGVTGPGVWLESETTGKELFVPFARRRARRKARRQAEYPPARGFSVDRAIMRTQTIREE